MSGLLNDFVIEAKDLIEQAGQSLLVLEDNPGDMTALNTLFRHVHTIKGGAGLFEPPGLVPTLHAAEDLLDRLRENEFSLTSDMTDVLLRALDQAVVWLEMLERDGALDPSESRIGEALARDLAAFVPNTGEENEGNDSGFSDVEGFDWLDDVEAGLKSGDDTTWALEFVPEENCFFAGGNPLATILALPGRRWMCVVPVAAWDEPENLDPFVCNVMFRVVSVASREALEQHLIYVKDQVKFSKISAEGGGQNTPDQELAIDILQGQIVGLAAEVQADVWPGRMIALATMLSRFQQRFKLPELTLDIIERIRSLPLEEVQFAIDTLTQTSDALRALANSKSGEVGSPSEAKGEASSGVRRDSTIKVDQEVMDQMVKLVGEMIVAKNALPFLVKRAEETFGNRRLALEIKSEYEAINRIVEDMQSAVMQMRMVPVSQVFQRYQRLVRDLSRRLEKKISLEMEGEDTKADKNIVEELADPLVHLIRNACDHGLEQPSERRASGKVEAGKIVLSARQVEDQVVIAVKDDGRGINVTRVREKAVENKLLPDGEVEKMDDRSAIQLILQPGFSTAEKVSDLSGRGVGMDVVNTMVKRSGGTMWIDSNPGEGSEISISLPMSVAVSQVMMFEVGETLYGIAIENIVETVRFPGSNIHQFKEHEQIMLRGRLVPLLRARKLFGLPKREEGLDDELSVLVVRNGEAEIGLVVDRVKSEADVKLESLDECLNPSGYFSGAALLGDGSIMLLVSARELF